MRRAEEAKHRPEDAGRRSAAKPAAAERTAGPAVMPKLCGADVELGGFVTGLADHQGTAALAARLLLREIHGVPANRWSTPYCLCRDCVTARLITSANCRSGWGNSTSQSSPISSYPKSLAQDCMAARAA